MKVEIKEKRFGENVVLENINFEVNKGDKLAILGPSGVGKTTLIRILSNLDTDFQGSVFSPFSFPSILFQEDRLINNISVRSSLRAVTDSKERITRLLGKVGLQGKENSKVSSLSGGMKRRVAIVRALLLSYDALILDEPFKGMDDALKRVVSKIIIEENKERALIVVTHSKEDLDFLKINKIIDLGDKNGKEVTALEY